MIIKAHTHRKFPSLKPMTFWANTSIAIELSHYSYIPNIHMVVQGEIEHMY